MTIDFLVIFLVGFVVLGPEDTMRVLRTIRKLRGELLGLTRELTVEVQQATEELRAPVVELRDTVADLQAEVQRSSNPAHATGLENTLQPPHEHPSSSPVSPGTPRLPTRDDPLADFSV